MSKRVEVKKTDSVIAWCGSLYLARDGRFVRRITDGSVFCTDGAMPSYISMEATRLPNNVARAWIESLGGEWAEVAEEKAATPYTLTLHVYEASQGSVLFNTKKCEVWGGKYLGTTTITIAGVP
jgi:hypothetical protein